MLGGFTVKTAWPTLGNYIVKPGTPYGLSYYGAGREGYGIGGLWQEANMMDAVWLVAAIAAGSIVLAGVSKMIKPRNGR